MLLCVWVRAFVLPQPLSKTRSPLLKHTPSPNTQQNKQPNKPNYSFKPEHAAKALTSQIYSPSNSVRIGAVLQLLRRGRGPLATTGCDHGAFVDSTGEKRKRGWPLALFCFGWLLVFV